MPFYHKKPLKSHGKPLKDLIKSKKKSIIEKIKIYGSKESYVGKIPYRNVRLSNERTRV